MTGWETLARNGDVTLIYLYLRVVLFFMSQSWLTNIKQNLTNIPVPWVKNSSKGDNQIRWEEIYVLDNLSKIAASTARTTKTLVVRVSP